MAAISLSIRSHLAQSKPLPNSDARSESTTEGANPITAIKFVTCCVVPPPKKEVLAYLGIPSRPGEKIEEVKNEDKTIMKRMAETDVCTSPLLLCIERY